MSDGVLHEKPEKSQADQELDNKIDNFLTVLGRIRRHDAPSLSSPASTARWSPRYPSVSARGAAPEAAASEATDGSFVAAALNTNSLQDTPAMLVGQRHAADIASTAASY